MNETKLKMTATFEIYHNDLTERASNLGSVNKITTVTIDLADYEVEIPEKILTLLNTFSQGATKLKIAVHGVKTVLSEEDFTV